MILKDILLAYQDFSPFSLQESYDNSGIQYGEPSAEVTKGLICLDVTEAIVEEAIVKQCDVIISHHPLIFKGIKSLTGKDYIQRALVKAIKNDIAIVSVHTNLDSVSMGVNEILARKIGLENLQILDPRKNLLKKLITFCPIAKADDLRKAIFEAGAGHIGEYDCCSFNLSGEGTFRAGEDANPYVGEKGMIHTEKEVRIETIMPSWLQTQVVKAMIEAHPYEEVAYDVYSLDNTHSNVGMGMIGSYNEPIAETEFLEKLKNSLACECIRHTSLLGKPIQKVALCGGSGSFLREKAMEAGADAFVTADMKYHEFFDVEERMLMADVGHYESEQFTKEILYEIVTKKFTNFALLISGQSTNPVRYF